MTQRRSKNSILCVFAGVSTGIVVSMTAFGPADRGFVSSFKNNSVCGQKKRGEKREKTTPPSYSAIIKKGERKGDPSVDKALKKGGIYPDEKLFFPTSLQ
ncbi:hypothetical protein AVEN_202237-1 [Araneus ventricosus]|uniref:Uncharacterized protein n=1 Tax=Araneus ventricosus TaxID=182803 RepID=A0A4Y2CMG2_ARAVE|nr:hypothetical protein AVEN_202237-1 [Araneus ventricosus]